jgi:hypothetical protein
MDVTESDKHSSLLFADKFMCMCNPIGGYTKEGILTEGDGSVQLTSSLRKVVL